MKKMEQKLQSVYEFICDFIKENAYPPTVREICKGLEITSTSLVYTYIDKLTKQGLLEKKGNKNRAIEVVNFTPDAIPLLGNVSAGMGLFAIENIEDYYSIPHQIFKGNELFLLRVKGNSMEKSGIFDKDYVVISKQSDVNDGEIALVLFDENATIKRLYRNNEQIILHPENDNMEDIVLTNKSTVQILGKVVGCIKRL